MKKIILSLAIIAMVGTVAVGVTRSFFSDTETSTGNTFTAGAIDLKVDSQCSYNGSTTNCVGNWGQPEGKDIVSEKFFDFGDIKPGDSGENTISLHVINNDAWVCAEVSNLVSSDVSQTEPESQALLDTDDMTSGELDDQMVWTIWRDNGDNIMNGSEVPLLSGHPVNGVLALYDSVTGTPLAGASTTYLGVSWSLPASSGNETQTDSLTANISFRVEQARNNPNFRCVPQQGPVVETRNVSLENKGENWQVIPDDQIYGLIQYSHNDTTFHGVVTGTGLVPNGKYQITLNGPGEASGTCGFTNSSLGNFSGGNTFKGGFWDSAWPNLSATCTANDEEGSYNMNLTGDHYTFIASGTGTVNYPFTLALPAGNYSGVKVLVKKMLDTHVSPWVDTTTVHTSNLFEVAPISFTILP